MYSVKIKDDIAEIFLYSIILGGDFDMSLQNVINELNSVECKNINVYINSEGGDILEAQCMHAFLMNYKAPVKIYIDGVCASAAGIVALAGDEIYMRENALFMMHNPSGQVQGESEDMRKLADVLDKLRDSIALLYEKKTGLSHKEIINMMDAETWLTAKEAKKIKLIDKILPALETGNQCENFQAGVKHERERIKALDEIATSETMELINKAKYETFQDARDIALDLLRIEARRRDSVSVEANMRVKETVDECIQSMSGLINKMRGYK